MSQGTVADWCAEWTGLTQPAANTKEKAPGAFPWAGQGLAMAGVARGRVKLGKNRDASSKAGVTQLVSGGPSAPFSPSTPGQDMSSVRHVFSLKTVAFPETLSALQPVIRAGTHRREGSSQIRKSYLVPTSLSPVLSCPPAHADSGPRGRADALRLSLLLRKTTCTQGPQAHPRSPARIPQHP